MNYAVKVGIIGTIWLNIPPAGYGGTELVIYNLVNGLASKGHDVTLFGPKTAQVKAKVIATVDKPLREQNIEWTNIEYILFHITQAFDRGSQFDILHMHVNKSQDYMALPLAVSSKTPVVFTPHFRFPTPQINPERNKVLLKYKALPFTSISDSQRGSLPINFVKTVYNSLDINFYPYNQNPKDYFVWIGKVNPLKGTKEAILAAKKAGIKLLVLGAVDKGVKQMFEYYEKEVKPLIDGKQIEWVGEVKVAKKAEILGNAKAFLNPILWEEPFGLVMAEAQATGTPVISFKRGAAVELIQEGKTGYLVETIDEMAEKIKQVDRLDRKACRKNIEDRFTVDKMVEGYEQVYEVISKNWQLYLDNYMQDMHTNRSQGI